MSQVQFELLEWTATGSDLLVRSRGLLVSAPSERVRALAERIPAKILAGEQCITVVFAGQYSAGKSTILKALTGSQDIAVGADITTDRSESYHWNGLDVVDTPGVHTTLRPDHDAIAYGAIADADLLVFVVTNELFDSHLAEHFRKLAIDREKCHEMMLVVNKMRRCASGNSREAQAAIREDLSKVMLPMDEAEFPTCFIDAHAALEGGVETDEEIAKLLLKTSGMDLFIEELNAFVREKGVAGRLTTALYGLEQVLQEALASESGGDEDIEGLEELLLQRRRALCEFRGRISAAVEGEVERTGSGIRHEGRRVADLIHGSADPSKVDRELQAAQEGVDRVAGELADSIETIIGRQIEDLGQRIESIANSELARELIPRLGRRIEEGGIAVETSSKLRKTSDISTKFGAFLVRNSFTAKSSSLGGLFKLNQYSGTTAHGAVKTVGHFFGKSFKPWEAVKWTRAVANAGRALVVVGTVLTFILQMKEDADAAQLERDLRESRSAVRAGFNDAAHAIETHYSSAVDAFIATTVEKESGDVDQQLMELRDMEQERSGLFNDLVGLLDETRSLIRSLHSKATSAL